MSRVTDVKRKRTRLDINNKAWDQAITDARQQFDKAKARAKRLQEMIADLERMKEAGELWPGLAKNSYTVTQKNK